MTDLRSLLALLPLTALCACATAPQTVAVNPAVAPAAAPAPKPEAARISPGDTPYGLFLAGQAAMTKGNDDAAADYFAGAASMDHSEAGKNLTVRAFSAALLAGDIVKAAALAPNDADTPPPVRRMGILTVAVEDLAEGKAKPAHDLLSGLVADRDHSPAEALLAPWAAAAAGDAEGSVVHPVINGEPMSQFFANLDQGRLFERAHRYDEAETAFRALIGGGDPGGGASRALGEMLERRGKQSDAVAIYDQALAHLPDDPALKAARARAAAKGKPPALAPLRQASAEALIAPATVMLIQKQQQMALVYLRLALRLDPERDDAWMLAGEALSDMNYASSAIEAYRAVRPGSDAYVEARIKLAWAYQGDDQHDLALSTARETAGLVPASRDAAATLADILRADEKYDESAKVLDGLIAGLGDQPDWHLLYMRAVDFQETDRWADAERDLQAALKQQPDEPELLNFLGYSWIDRGERLPEAMAMIKKAVELDPKNGAMIDSLGWGYYRMGDYKTAVEKLEQAIILEPADPDVNNHLGDAYWRAGRQLEAQFQWRRVLGLEPSAKLKAEVEAKLKSGLDPLPAKPAVVAGQ